MKKFIRFYKPIFILLIILFTMILLLISLLIVRSFPNSSEYYSRNIAKFFVAMTTTLTAYFPFTIIELYVINLSIVVIILIIFIIKFLKRKKIEKGITFSLITAIIIFSIPLSFMATQGVNYNRMPINIPQYNEKVDKNKYKNIASYYINDFNECANSLTFLDNGEIEKPYDIYSLGKNINEEYKKYNNDYFANFNVNVKPLLFSPLFTQMHITGITFAPLGDVGINIDVPNNSLPFTVAHEIAHIKGASREEDAQLTAMFITLNSEDRYIRYSGYCSCISSLLNLTKYTGNKSDYDETIKLIDNKIKKNLEYNSNFWNSHSALVPLAQFVNNLFLKSNGESGTSAYDDKSIIDPKTGEIKVYSRYQKLFFYMFFYKK